MGLDIEIRVARELACVDAADRFCFPALRLVVLWFLALVPGVHEGSVQGVVDPFEEVGLLGKTGVNGGRDGLKDIENDDSRHETDEEGDHVHREDLVPVIVPDHGGEDPPRARAQDANGKGEGDAGARDQVIHENPSQPTRGH